MVADQVPTHPQQLCKTDPVTGKTIQSKTTQVVDKPSRNKSKPHADEIKTRTKTIHQKYTRFKSIPASIIPVKSGPFGSQEDIMSCERVVV